MDFGLHGRVVWIFGASSPAVWEFVEAFLDEEAVVRLITTRGAGWALGRRLQLHAGRNLRIVTPNEGARLLSSTLLPSLLDAGGPAVIVLIRSAGSQSDPSAQEWDQLLLSRVAELTTEPTVVVVTFDRDATPGVAEAVESAITRARRCHQTWLARAGCTVSLIASYLDPMAETGLDGPRNGGLAALAIFMASLGRGRVAMVTTEGSVHMI